MAATALTPVTVKGPYPGTVGAGDLVITPAAADASNGNNWTASGNDLLLWVNSGASGRTITITSSLDDKGRSGTITTYAVAAGAYGAFKFSSLVGWADSSGKITVTASHAEMLLTVIRL